jgi:hypothetical protein
MFRNVPQIPDHSAAVQVPGPPAGSDRASDSESASGSDSESVTEIVTEFKLTFTVNVGLSRSHSAAALAIFRQCTD